MKTIFRKWKCWKIASNSQYIAALGSGVTILKRSTLEEVCHFTGIKYILGGAFINEDILAVYTTEQKIIFLQISDKKLLWNCPRPKALSTAGDIRCCTIPDTQKIACIASGKKGIDEHYFLLIDYEKKTVTIRELLNCHRVVHSLVWTTYHGLTFLSYEAEDNGNLSYRITRVSDNGECIILCEWKSSEIVNAYTGNYVFMNNYKPKLQVKAYKLIQSQHTQNTVLQSTVPIPFQSFRFTEAFGCVKEYLPKISWVDESRGLIIGYTSDWIGIYSFFSGHLIAEYFQSNISCGTIIDKTLLIGCLPGLLAEELNGTWDGSLSWPEA